MSITYTDSRSAVKIDQHSFTVPAGEDGFVLLIDNSDAVENGQSPSGTVQVELTYVENSAFEYKFSVLGFIFGLPLVILITVAGIDLLFMRNDLRKIQIFDQALNYISKFLEHKPMAKFQNYVE